MEIDRQEALERTKIAIQTKKIDELGRQDDYQAVFSTGRGLNESVIRAISAEKKEQSGCLTIGYVLINLI